MVRLRDDLFGDEPNLWQYFVEVCPSAGASHPVPRPGSGIELGVAVTDKRWQGAPINLTSTIRSVRKLVNGSPGLLDSLSFRGGVIPSELEEAYRAGGYCEIVLDEPPLAVNVRVGGKTSPNGSAPGTAPGSVLWHGVELDDLTGLITPLTNDAQVISLLIARSPEKAELTGMVAAQTNVAETVLVRCFAYMIAFALTDFKLRASRGTEPDSVGQANVDPVATIHVRVPADALRCVNGRGTDPPEAHSEHMQEVKTALDDLVSFLCPGLACAHAQFAPAAAAGRGRHTIPPQPQA